MVLVFLSKVGILQYSRYRMAAKLNTIMENELRKNLRVGHCKGLCMEKRELFMEKRKLFIEKRELFIEKKITGGGKIRKGTYNIKKMTQFSCHFYIYWLMELNENCLNTSIQP